MWWDLVIDTGLGWDTLSVSLKVNMWLLHSIWNCVPESVSKNSSFSWSFACCEQPTAFAVGWRVQLLPPCPSVGSHWWSHSLLFYCSLEIVVELLHLPGDSPSAHSKLESFQLCTLQLVQLKWGDKVMAQVFSSWCIHHLSIDKCVMLVDCRCSWVSKEWLQWMPHPTSKYSVQLKWGDKFVEFVACLWFVCSMLASTMKEQQDWEFPLWV